MEKQQAPAIRRIVVVVDDDPAVRNSLKFSLEIEGFVVRAYSGAADLLNDGDLDGCGCLIVDQNMVGMNGLDLVANLRRRQVSAPAILITTHPTPALRERAAKAGISIVEKPLLGNSLMENIHEALARPRPTSM